MLTVLSCIQGNVAVVTEALSADIYTATHDISENFNLGIKNS